MPPSTENGNCVFIQSISTWYLSHPKLHFMVLYRGNRIVSLKLFRKILIIWIYTILKTEDKFPQPKWSFTGEFFLQLALGSCSHNKFLSTKKSVDMTMVFLRKRAMRAISSYDLSTVEIFWLDFCFSFDRHLVTRLWCYFM